MTPEETIEKLKLLGLGEQKAKETLKNAKVTKFLLAALSEVRSVSRISRKENRYLLLGFLIMVSIFNSHNIMPNYR